jgi:TRAP-type C4-dicarboxylate transport system permease small subunit
MVDNGSNESQEVQGGVVMASPRPTPRASSKRLLRIIGGIGDWSAYIAEALGIFGLSLGIILQLWDVLCRNLDFKSLDPSWISDGSSLALILGALIYVAATRVHLGFTGIAEVLNNKTLKRRLEYVTNPLVAALLIFLAYYGILLVKDQIGFGGSYSTAFYSPLWLFYAAFPLTCILAAIRWLTRSVKRDDDDDDDDFIIPPV